MPTEDSYRETEHDIRMRELLRELIPAKDTSDLLFTRPTAAASTPCPKQHRFYPVSLDEETGEAVYACKCGIEVKRQAQFMCEVEGAA